MLDSGTTSNTTTTLDSAEEEETNGNQSSTTYWNITFNTDGDNVQADAPDDSADISERSSGSTSGSSSKNFVDAGVYVQNYCINAMYTILALTAIWYAHVYYTCAHVCANPMYTHIHTLTGIGDPLWKTRPLALKYDFAVGCSILDSLFFELFFGYSESIIVLYQSIYKISARSELIQCVCRSKE